MTFKVESTLTWKMTTNVSSTSKFRFDTTGCLGVSLKVTYRYKTCLWEHTSVLN